MKYGIKESCKAKKKVLHSDSVKQSSIRIWMWVRLKKVWRSLFRLICVPHRLKANTKYYFLSLLVHKCLSLSLSLCEDFSHECFERVSKDIKIHSGKEHRLKKIKFNENQIHHKQFLIFNLLNRQLVIDLPITDTKRWNKNNVWWNLFFSCWFLMQARVKTSNNTCNHFFFFSCCCVKKTDFFFHSDA